MKPILRDVPFELETERLTIRGPLPGDGASYNAAVAESHAELKPWMAWAAEVDTVDDSEVWVREMHAKYLTRQVLAMALFLKGTGTLIGSSGLHGINWDLPSFEIGYWVRTAYAGQGYITEAVAAIEKLAFDLGAVRVAIECDVRNERSAAIPRRLGYQLEGTRRNDSRAADGTLRDTYQFAKTQTPPTPNRPSME